MTPDAIAERYRDLTDTPGSDNRIICPAPQHSGDRSDPNTTLFSKGQGRSRSLGAKCHSNGCPESSILAALSSVVGDLTLSPPQAQADPLWTGAPPPLTPTSPILSRGWKLTDPSTLPDYSERNTSHSVLYYGSPGQGNTRSYRLDRPAALPCTWKDRPCKLEGTDHKHCWQDGGAASTCQVNIYSAQALTPETPIFLCEGEKAARAVALAGYASASYCGGAENARTANYAPLKPYPVYIWPDNDGPGLRAARQSYTHLTRLGCPSVVITDYVGASESGADAADLPRADLLEYLSHPPAMALDTLDLEVGGMAINDVYLCLRFLRDHAARLVVATRPGVGPSDIYVVTDNGLLSQDPGELAPLLHESAQKYGGDIIVSGLRGSDLNSAVRHARSYDNNGCIDVLRTAAKGAITLLQKNGLALLDLQVVEHNAIDTDLTVLGFPNGVLDIRTGEMLPPQEARWRLVATKVTQPYYPGATHPLIDHLLPSPHPDPDAPTSISAALAPDVLDFWYRARGWALTHHPDRELIAIVTEGNAGKSTWMNADKAALGAISTTIRSQALRTNKYDAGGSAHNGDLVAFGAPCRLVYASEIKEIDVTLANQISGGESLRVREIREKSEVIEVTASLVLLGNTPEAGARLLGVGGDGEDAKALRDRIRLIPMPRIPDDKVNPFFKQAWKDPAFLQAYLARTVEWMQEMVDVPRLPPNSGSMQAALEAQVEHEQPDWRREWLPEILIPCDEEERYANSDQVYEAYRAYEDSMGNRWRHRAKRGVTEAVLTHYDIQNKKSGYSGLGKNRVKVTIFTGWQLRPDAAPASHNGSQREDDYSFDE